MSRSVGRTLVFVASLACAGAFATPVRAQAVQQEAIQASVAGIAAQLGIKPQGPEADDLRLGSSFTAMLEQPEKLADVGITGMHAGARVTVARVAPDKVRVEADEMEPVSRSAAVTLRLAASGALSKLPKS